MSDTKPTYEDVIESLRWEADYWQWVAIHKNWRPWWIGWRIWPPIWRGSDEAGRITLVIGPVVFPLWRCRCHHCGPEYAALERRLDDTPKERA